VQELPGSNCLSFFIQVFIEKPGFGRVFFV
jgi:hypothetical protein